MSIILNINSLVQEALSPTQKHAIIAGNYKQAHMIGRDQKARDRIKALRLKYPPLKLGSLHSPGSVRGRFI